MLDNDDVVVVPSFVVVVRDCSWLWSVTLVRCSTGVVVVLSGTVRVEVNKFSKKKEKLTGERRWQMKRRSKPYTTCV